MTMIAKKWRRKEFQYISKDFNFRSSPHKNNNLWPWQLKSDGGTEFKYISMNLKFRSSPHKKYYLWPWQLKSDGGIEFQYISKNIKFSCSPQKKIFMTMTNEKWRRNCISVDLQELKIQHIKITIYDHDS